MAWDNIYYLNYFKPAFKLSSASILKEIKDLVNFSLSTKHIKDENLGGMRGQDRTISKCTEKGSGEWTHQNKQTNK